MEEIRLINQLNQLVPADIYALIDFLNIVLKNRKNVFSQPLDRADKHGSLDFQLDAEEKYKNVVSIDKYTLLTRPTVR